ncbi:TIGR02611 family protein [Modestobacter sp. VKM Ac-2676]|nr:TIGR02611 family protein [Modestobacter sp. VKM Ac-2676]
MPGAGDTVAEAGQRERVVERRDQFAGDGVHSLRERVADSAWRRRIAARRAFDAPYRVGVGIVGGLVVAVGIVTIPLPGPGWLTVIAGLFVLASEFTWAERLLAFTRHHVGRWTSWLGRQRLWIRLAVAALTATFVVAVLVVTLHLMGVPDWVPGWVPLWR